MKKALKWIGILISGLVGLLVIAAVGLIVSTNNRLDKVYEIEPEPLIIPTDAENLANGEHWVEIHCRECHEEDLGGGPFFEDPAIGIVDAPNLTSGQGGIGDNYSDDDWILALRHGVRQDGRSVFIMPSNDFYYLTDNDLAGIIAYMKSVPPVDREIRDRSLSPMGKILYAAGAFGNVLYAETIEHDVRPDEPADESVLEYGDYLVTTHGCRSCHGDALSGKQPSEPGAPFAPNLTPGGNLSGWSEADFIQTIRSGVTPDGQQLSESMPWNGLGKLTDQELQTIWMYLNALDPLATTN